MSDDLVKRLRELAGDENGHRTAAYNTVDEAADRIEELEKRVEQAKMVFATMRSEMVNVCAVMKAFEDE